MRCDVLVGAQLGSEGKGAIAKHIADDYGMHIRVGGPNAGHTIYHKGHEWKMRSVPCGWVNPNAKLVIGPGALIDLEVLQDEIDELQAAGYWVADRLYIDNKAAIITRSQREVEGGVRGYAHRSMGSTGEGCGATRIARINRDAIMPNGACGDWTRYVCARDANRDVPGRLTDTTGLMLNYQGRSLLEGTQGTGLSVIHGEWPWVTSADTTAMGILSDAGIPVSCVRDVILVARTFPIRVAGNSGPLPGETTFAEIGQPEERTTVTHKVRRIARFDREQFRRAVRLNGATRVAITFADYVDPDMKGRTTMNDYSRSFHRWMLMNLGSDALDYVRHIGTGPDSVMDVWC